ncbi:glycoside hydrolase family 15 protein [Rothia uropygioeca]|uniref:glycoside hydrolase family 15 protein n=1 Tax=Kocuria sp. 257 TaxID=2021970 RepID=UPI0010130D16|nr:glycoside hydrolase family 15 protein [Kocuria sp. 257]
MSDKRIEDYGLIGDLHTAALVGLDGSIDWLCLPHFDDRACLAALLDDESAGYWSLAPTGHARLSRRDYDAHSLVLRTRWESTDGIVDVIDFMPPRDEAANVVRIVEGVEGRVQMSTSLCLRFDYGRITPWIHAGNDAPGTPCSEEFAAVAGPDAVWVRTDVPLRHEAGTLNATFDVSSGKQIAFVLTHKPSYLPPPAAINARHALKETTRFWSRWIDQCTYNGPWSREVHRSLMLLKALTYAPTGGIVAAVTTSLPEQLGGSRNWDYRYCWLRDATFTLEALINTGYTDEALAWRAWLVRAVAGDPSKLQIMYGLDGTQRIPEMTLDWLNGYQGSRPVRVGNAAAGQHQLDVWGETLDGLHLAREAGLQANDSAWDLQRSLVDWIQQHWQEPDNGLWEMRGPKQHFVHSKVMAWVGVDRAIRAVEQQRLPGDVATWKQLAQAIHADICAHGFDPKRNTFTQFYGSHGLDASLLLLPRVGFLPWDDPRIIGTVEAVAQELDSDGFLLRYDNTADGNADGLSGRENAFLVCSFWLVDAWHGIGEHQRAEHLFERLLALRNDLGLLSEEYDTQAHRHMGNTPQAFSLVGLINSAQTLSGQSDPLITREASR